MLSGEGAGGEAVLRKSHYCHFAPRGYRREESAGGTFSPNSLLEKKCRSHCLDRLLLGREIFAPDHILHAAWDLPGDGQMVAATAFFLQRFDVIALPGLEGDQD